MGVLRRLDHNGDTETTWNPQDEDNTGVAKFIFNQHIRAGGLAFEVPADPREPAEVIRRFRPEAREIILAPRMVGG